MSKMRKNLAVAPPRARVVYDIGTAAAENDEFLSECFVNTGDYDIVREVSNPKSIVVGRTGVGKSALIKRLIADESDVIVIPPETLSLPHICNSPVLRHFEENGVSLDPFYQLLWRHVIVVELLRHKYSIKNETDQRNCLQKIKDVIRKDKNKEKALDFLQKWGDQFWNEVGVRTTQFREKLENNLQSEVGAKVPGFQARMSGGHSLTREEQKDFIHYGQAVVNKVQIKDLTIIIDLLAEDVFTRKDGNYYVVIDGLDEAWAPTDTLRFKLIRSLIESVRAFRKISAVKVVVAMRSDLLESVYDEARGPGFQEEKFRDFCLSIQWQEGQIRDMLNRRIRYFDAQTGGNGSASLRIKMPDTESTGGKGKSPDTYFFERTLMRPRNAILFFNACLKAAKNKNRFTWTSVYQAEKEYSGERLKSLKEEWGNIYPNVLGYVKILENRAPCFKVSDITKDEVHTLFADRLSEDASYNEDDPMCKMFKKHLDSHLSFPNFRHELIKVLFKMEVIGIQKNPADTISYSFNGSSTLSRADARENFIVWIHPAFRKGVGVRERDQRHKK